MLHLVCRLLLEKNFFHFFNDTATTEIYTLSLHDALPISISDVLQQQHEGMGSAADMMMSLEEIHMVGKVATIKTRQKVKE